MLQQQATAVQVISTSMRSVCEHLLTSGSEGSTAQDSMTPQITASHTQHFYSLLLQFRQLHYLSKLLIRVLFPLERGIIVSPLGSPQLSSFTWHHHCSTTVDVTALALTKEASHPSQPITGDHLVTCLPPLPHHSRAETRWGLKKLSQK